MIGDNVVATGTSYFVDEEPEGRTLVVTGAWSAEAAAVIRGGGADGLWLNYARGFQERDLTLLDGLPVRRLNVLARTVKDISPIYGLAGTLESVAVEAAAGTVLDLTRLPRVHTLQAGWATVAETLGALPGLRRLYTSDYPEPDLRALVANPTLTTVRMKNAPALRTLAGVDALSELSELAVILARRLEDIDDLRYVSADADLYDVELEDCPSLSRLDALAHLTRLRACGFNDCRNVETLAPLRGLASLEVVAMWGNTRVRDGDLSPLAGLPRLRELRMQDRRYYVPRVAEIQARLAGAT